MVTAEREAVDWAVAARVAGIVAAAVTKAAAEDSAGGLEESATVEPAVAAHSTPRSPCNYGMLCTCKSRSRY